MKRLWRAFKRCIKGHKPLSGKQPRMIGNLRVTMPGLGGRIKKERKK